MPQTLKKLAQKSNHDFPVILSLKAEEDFTDILQYTLQTWGENQVYVYRTVVDKALQTIQQNPEIGQPRPALSQRHRTMLF